jgi:zinc protease
VKTGTLILLLSLPRLGQAQATPPIPARPEALVFKPVVYNPPRAEDYKVVLKNGMTVFVAEDKTLPLVNIHLMMRVGGYLDPAGKEGLAEFVGSQMRRGGTKSLAPEQLDERLDVLAALVGTHISATSGLASLNCLKDTLDESLKLFVEILREPRFDAERLTLAKEANLQEMRKRNDEAADIEQREWRVLVLGEDHFTNRFVTETSVNAITREDLVSFHKTYVHPAQMVASVSGSFDRAAILEKLEAAFAEWPTPQPKILPVPSATHPAPPGLYRIEKDVNQGRVSIGLPTVKREDPDSYALEVMNEILGGGGFTSRITKTVRSDEGLAYEAGSRLELGVYYPGDFRAVFQSKSESVSYATSLVLAEVEKIRTSPVTREELDTVKKSLIETFPSHFSTVGAAMGLFASEEFTGRSPEYLRTYRDKIAAVTPADVQRVAKDYLDPQKMIALVVGDQKAIDKGDSRHAVDLAGLFKGRVSLVPLRDPMTMKKP